MPVAPFIGDMKDIPTRSMSYNSLVAAASTWKSFKHTFEIIFKSEHRILFDFLYDKQQITADFSKIRQKHFHRLDKLKTTYLDYTGGGLYSEILIENHCDYLKNSILGNPHSTNPTSIQSTIDVMEATATTLSFFNADPEEYAVIFTANCSAALKIVGESFPFTAESQYLTLTDAHNSVNGIGRFAQSKDAKWTVHPLDHKHEGIIINSDSLEIELANLNTNSHNLFGLTGQSNATGQKHSLDWIETAQKRGWNVVLDMAALCPTSKVDFSIYKPEFACLSFYKMFGYPTGVGALIAKKSALKILQKPVLCILT
jgi:molybdenum cofactor sulfurtransferase